MSDLQTLFSLRPSEISDEELEKLTNSIRAMRHTFNATAKETAGKKPAAPKPPATEAAAAAQRLASQDLFKL